MYIVEAVVHAPLRLQPDGKPARHERWQAIADYLVKEEVGRKGQQVSHQIKQLMKKARNLIK
jgi:hypothetical protein